MKKKLVLAFFCVINTQFFLSQTLEEIELCTALQSNQFYSEVEADSALDRILDASGLAKNFTLTQCDNIDNAAAISYKGVRYILYDKEFLQTITDYTNDWANLFILAHEVGHHLNGHSVDVSMIDIVESKTLEVKRRQELEADEFAAFVLAQLGAPLTALIEPIELVVSDEDDRYSTHPKRSKRISAIREGYSKGGFSKRNNISNQKTQPIDVITVKNPLKINTEERWQLTKIQDPFSRFKNVASVKGSVNGELESSIILEAKQFNDGLNNGKIILLNELESISAFNSIFKQVHKTCKELIESPPIIKTIKHQKWHYKGLAIKISFDIDIAIDNELSLAQVDDISNTIYLQDYPIKTNLGGFQLYPYPYLIKELKEGSQLAIRFNSYSISYFPLYEIDGIDGIVHGTTDLVTLIDDLDLNPDLKIIFPLKGSSYALSWWR